MTINTLKKNMKIKALSFIVLFVLWPTSNHAQDVFSQYEDDNRVSYVSMKPKMFQMIAKMGISSEDPEAKAFIDMVNSITSFKTLTTEDEAIASKMSKWVSQYSKTLEELMVMKDNGIEVKFYVKEGSGKDDKLEELLIFVNGTDFKGKSAVQGRDFKNVIISLKGAIDLNQISKLTKQLNIPGGDQLKNK